MKGLLSLLEKDFPGKEVGEIQEVVMDSRKAKKGRVFFAIQGGNAFVAEALEAGAFVIADSYEGEEHPRLAKVKDSIAYMQDLAKAYRDYLGLCVIAITGSNGKTTTKDIVYAILSKSAATQKTAGNYNNHIGLPFTILNLQEQTKYAVLEMGMSHLGEIAVLGEIARPDYAMITNIGDSHLENLGSREGVFQAKTEILDYVNPEAVISSGDDVFLRNIAGMHVGFEEGEHRILNYRREGGKTLFVLDGKEYRLPLEGRHNAMNAAMAILLAKTLGLSEEEIAKNLEEISLSPMRFQHIKAKDRNYINDAYNASPLSMQAAFDSFAESEAKDKVLVLGDMLELGVEEIKLHEEVLKAALEKDFQEILLYGERMKKAGEKLRGLQFFDTKEAIQEHLRGRKGQTVLLKGSRGMRLEDIIEGEM